MKKTIITIVIIVIIAVAAYLIWQYQSGEQEAAPMTETETPTLDENSAYTDISPEQAYALIMDPEVDLVVIDVSPHYNDGHLPGAVNYYLGDGSLDQAIPTLDKGKTYLVYCHVDSVAISGAKKLAEAGFMKIFRLEGNFSAWKKGGYPIEY